MVHDTTLVEEPALDHLITLPHQVSPSKLRRELNIIAAPNRLLAGIADELCKKTFSMVLHGTVYHVVWILPLINLDLLLYGTSTY